MSRQSKTLQSSSINQSGHRRSTKMKRNSFNAEQSKITLTLEENMALLEQHIGAQHQRAADDGGLIDIISVLLPQFEMRMQEQAKYENQSEMLSLQLDA